jgi:hypothetical protein
LGIERAELSPLFTLQDLTPIMNENNLARTIQLIDLCFKLKEAYLRQQHPEASPEKIRDLINRGILARKEQQWASPEICLTP